MMHVDAPRRNGWTSRAVRARSGPRMVAARSVTLIAAGDDTSSSSSSTDGPRPVALSSAPAVTVMRAPASVPVLAITCSAVGGVVALAIIFALVYVRRVKRRVKSMKRRTNVLGPGARISRYYMIRLRRMLTIVLFLCLELTPMSPSQLSQFTIDSPRLKPDMMLIAPPRRTSDLTSHLPSLSASFVSSPISVEHPTSVHHSTIVLSPPPAARRPTIIHSPDARSPYRSSHAAVPWPLITSGSWSNPRHEYEKCNTGSDTSESTRA